MKLTRRYEKMTPEKRPQDPSMDGTGLTLETLAALDAAPVRELRFDARSGSPILVHRQPVSPFGDGELPEVRTIASRFLHVRADLGKVLYFRDVCIADDDHQARRSGPATLENISRKYFEMIGHAAQQLKAHSIGGGEGRW